MGTNNSMPSKFYPAKAGLFFWLKWVCVTTLGFLVSLYWVEVGFKPDVGAIQGAIGGTAIGFAQWLVLRHYLPHAWRWGVASAVAWTVLGFSDIGVMGWVAPRTDVISLRLMYGMVHGLKAGLVIGIAQWFILQVQFSQVWWWIPASSLSWAIALSYGWVIGILLRLKMKLFLAEVLGLAAGWVGVAAITGIALAVLMNCSARRVRQPARGSQERSRQAVGGRVWEVEGGK